MKTTWTAGDLERAGRRYIDSRSAGMGMVEARINAQQFLTEDKQYSDNTCRTKNFPLYIRNVYDNAEYELQYGVPKAVEAAPVAPEPTQDVVPAAPSKQVVELDDLPSEALFAMAFKKMKREVADEYNGKLMQLLDIMTAPDATKDHAQELLLEMVVPKERLPKVCVIGLLPSQYNIVHDKVHHKFRIVNFTPDETGSASMQNSLKNCDLAVTMTNFINHSTEAVARKHATKWMPHSGGVSGLVEVLLRTVL